MPLVKASMKSAFLTMYLNKPGDRTVVAQKWAQAYDMYAALAVTPNGGSAVVAGKRVALEAALRQALSLPTGVAAVVASAWGVALTAYWTGLPFTPGAVPAPPFMLPGVAVAPVGVSALVSTLTAVYLRKDSEENFAEAQASALDVCTKTVLVAFGPLPQPVV